MLTNKRLCPATRVQTFSLGRIEYNMTGPDAHDPLAPNSTLRPFVRYPVAVPEDQRSKTSVDVTGAGVRLALDCRNLTDPTAPEDCGLYDAVVRPHETEAHRNWTSSAWGTGLDKPVLSGEGTYEVRFRAASGEGLVSAVVFRQPGVCLCPPAVPCPVPVIRPSGHTVQSAEGGRGKDKKGKESLLEAPVRNTGAHKSALESANPRVDSECAAGCTWSTARAAALLWGGRPE